MTLRYRPAGSTEWKRGMVENISRSGVLFRAQEQIGLQAAVDIALELEIPKVKKPQEVVCWAVVVRGIPGDESLGLLAARIVHYDFVRPDAQEAIDVFLSPPATGHSN